MCVVCGWCRSFTNTERALLAVQAVLLVVAGALLLLLVLHMVACRDRLTTGSTASPSNTTTDVPTDIPTGGDDTDDVSPSHTSTGLSSTDTPAGRTTTSTNIKCTWEPSVQTEPGKRYYLRPEVQVLSGNPGGPALWDGSGLLLVEGHEEAGRCAGVAVSVTWALTAGGCERGARRAGGRRVIETRLHPSVPLALLKTDPAPRDQPSAVLPSALQAALVGPGERLTVLGYYFSDKSSQYEARSESVWSLPRGACSSGSVRAVRHILPLGALSGAGCPRVPLCAGAASWAGRGVPLLRGRQVLAILTDTSTAGTASYTSLAAVREWIVHVVST